MHREKIESWRHNHVFNIEKKAIEKRTLIVVIVTFVTMAAEISFGLITNSMALLADGWHMGTHALALGVSLFAYILARRHARNAAFTFGTWKIEILGAYTSAIVLGIVGAIMIFSSVERLIHPLSIQYSQALLVAVLGLAVNLACAIILNAGGHSHDHSHGHEQHEHQDDHADEEHAHRKHDDLNFKSAYLHVVADALTSVLAIGALLGAKYFTFTWLDPFMGLVGAGLIIRWSYSLLKDTGGILLEHETDTLLSDEIRHAIESDGDSKVSDLHIWKVAQHKYACIVSLVTSKKHTTVDYKLRLKKVHELAHTTIEINKYSG
ncbi:MAG: CDF family Co(II)/Ni(II) efflux transporter DmeF [Spirochaetes bacterium]|nr:CDF family Co(II)/Ni(II) efflux transporter DmeF [Spirochaetota bacterium]